jgi:uncharacterized RDD family membrane protein YckC
MATPTPGTAPPPAPGGAPSFSLGGYIGTPGALEGVGFWPRAGARIIDLVLHYIASIFAGLVLGILIGILGTAMGRSVPGMIARMRGFSFIAFSLALLGSMAYHSICEAMSGNTLGKRLLSLVVVQEDGSPCSFDSALRRSLVYYVDALFFGLIGYMAMQKTPQQQRYGDQWAHTIVCKRDQIRPENLRDGGRFALALFVGMAADGLLMITGWLLAILT